MKYPVPPGSSAYLRDSVPQEDAKADAVAVGGPTSSREDQQEAQTGALATDRPLINNAHPRSGGASSVL